jgi:hypothetical protein
MPKRKTAIRAMGHNGTRRQIIFNALKIEEAFNALGLSPAQAKRLMTGKNIDGFSAEELLAARKKLSDLGYKPENW